MDYPNLECKNLQNEVHIWAVDIDQWKISCNKAEQMLPKSEREKSERFRFEILKTRYINSHYLLRTLLGMYIGIDYFDQEFHINNYGKPFLKNTHAEDSIYFNISNSENVCVFACTKDGDLGVDVEKIHDLPDMDRIVERLFSQEENKIFHSLPEHTKKTSFFKYWTRKEALLKAMGVGLSFPADQINVLSGQADTSIIKSNAMDEKTDWTFQDIDVFEGFAAALALKGNHTGLRARLRYVKFGDDIIRRRKVRSPIYNITPTAKPSVGDECFSCKQRRSI